MLAAQGMWVEIDQRGDAVQNQNMEGLMGGQLAS